MPKFKTEHFHFSDKRERESTDILEFSGDININAEGKFYVNLPRAVVDKFIEAGINAGGRSRNFENGYFESDTFDGLKQAINELGSDYISKEVVSRTLKIEYSIETNCAYAFEDGNVYPNGYYIKDKSEVDYWRDGTIKRMSTSLINYGFQIYAKPFCEVIYKYRSGKTFSKKLYHPSETDGLGEHGKWLDDLIRQQVPENGKLREIEYTEEIALFFRKLFESLFRLNEQIKDRFEPEQIRQLATGFSGGLFLNPGDNADNTEI